VNCRFNSSDLADRERTLAASICNILNIINIDIHLIKCQINYY